MKLRHFFSLLLLCALCISVVSGQDVPEIYQPKYLYLSSATADSNAIEFPKKLLKSLGKLGLVWIDPMHFEPETQNGYDTIFNVTKSIQTGGFFLKNTEVSNLEYKVFQQSFAASAYLPDTGVWNDDLMFNTHPFVHYYYQHSAYNQFPVVGVSQWQAMAFCKWKTEQLNFWLKSNGLGMYEAQVSLPTESEFQSAYEFLYPKWLLDQKHPCFTGTMARSSQAYVLGCNGYRANFGNITTYRVEQLRLPFNGGSTNTHWITSTVSFPKVYGVYNLLGNVAEWTSTKGNDVLFNTEEYYLGMNGKILTQTYKQIDSSILLKRLHLPEELGTHFVIKGGGWDDDIFYLQPSAIRMAQQYKSYRDVGFRYAVHISIKD